MKCVHGTYIGDRYGPDYLCGYCEDAATKPVIRTVYVLRCYVKEDTILMRTHSEIKALEDLNDWSDRFEDTTTPHRFYIEVTQETGWDAWDPEEDREDYITRTFGIEKWKEYNELQ